MENTTRPVEVVVFDLDGTLVHTLPDIHVAVNAMLTGLGRRSLAEDETRAMIGHGAQALIADAFRATGPGGTEDEIAGGLARFIAAYEASPALYSKPYDGVAECLEGFARRGLRLCVCTNKPASTTHLVLTNLGLSGYFESVIAGDTLAVKKPDAAPVLEALARIGAQSARAVMVGDSETDAAAAKSAGLPFVAVSFGYSQTPVSALGAHAVIDRFDALPTVIDRLAGC